MRPLRWVLAVAGAAALTMALPRMAGAQVPTRQAARVAYEPPSGSELAVNEVIAFVSLPDTLKPGQQLYITITGPAPAKRSVPATPGCQEVPLALPQNGEYQVVIETEVPSTVDAAGKCKGGSTAPGRFVVNVPTKAPAASPTSAPGARHGGGARAGRAGGGRSGGAGGGRIAGIDVARFEAEFDRLSAQAGGRPGEPSFESSLPYDDLGDRDEPDEELGADEARTNRRNTLAFVAGGVLALVTFTLSRWLRNEVDRRTLTT